MSLRIFLPALGVLCLFCSSAQAQTLDDDLLTVTVDFHSTLYYDSITGDPSYSPSLTYSITSFGLPQGAFMDVDGLYSASYLFTSSASSVEAVPFREVDCIAGGVNYLFRGSTGPIAASGTYPMSTTTYIEQNGCNQNIVDGTGDIIVAVATPAPTPEPFSASLMAIGFATLAVRRHLGRKHGR